MDNEDIRRRLQVAFSHREKASAAHAESQRLVSTGNLSPPQYEVFRKDCESHVVRAGASIAAIKSDIARKSVTLADELRRAIEDKKRLLQRLTARRGAEKETGKALRRVELRIERLRASLNELNALHAAKCARDAGGYIDLPLNRYHSGVLKRLRSPIRVKLSNWAALVIFAAGLAGAALFTFAPAGLSAGIAQFDIQPSRNGAGLVTVTCRNTGKRPITLSVPLAGQPAIEGVSQYGIAVYAQESAGGPWKLLPAASGCWRYGGRPLPAQNTFSIEPGISLELTLDPAPLLDTGANPQTLRIDCGKTGARPIASLEVSLAAP